jgi:hypothetical protein
MGRKFEAAASRSCERASSFLLHTRGRSYDTEFAGTVDPSVRERGDQRGGMFELIQVAFLACF